MARQLKEYGQYSIMHVAKCAYWPTGMSVEDMVQTLGIEYGSYKLMISTVPGESMMVVSFRNLKTEAIVSICGVTVEGKNRRFKDPSSDSIVENKRPKVFDEYEENKSKQIKIKESA